MKPQLIIISDLWGFKHTNWIENYQKMLAPKYSITLLDARLLAGIDHKLKEEQTIHIQFVNGGIDRAVEKLLQLEHLEVSCVGFSVGGLIAWKAALQGLNIKQLISISATRLRYETQKPSTDIQLFFGDQDPYRPTQEWLEAMDVNYQLLAGGHEIYKESGFIKDFIEQL